MENLMNTELAANRLSSLGNPTRLSLFRLLIRAGKEGMNIGDIQSKLNVPASTLAHHIQALEQTGMVKQKKRGREVINTADYEAMNDLVSYLTDECCQGFTKENNRNTC